jgi:hypothetical protein
MGRTYLAYLPEQNFLLPPSLGDWLPEDHLAYFVRFQTEYFARLAEKGLLIRTGRGRYKLYHPLFREFLRQTE